MPSGIGPHLRSGALPRWGLWAIALIVLTVKMDDRASRLLGLRDGFGGLDPVAGLASGLRTWVDGGIECRGEVVCWAPAPEHADDAPGRAFDLTGWECDETRFHLEDFVPVRTTDVEGPPLIGLDAQRTLLRQGIALAREVGRLAGELSTPIPLRCIIGVNETCGTFRFHRIRPGENWLLDDLDSYERGYGVVIDFLPRPVGRFHSARIDPARRAALFDLVELLAPDAEKARGRMEYFLDNASWSAFDPEDALIETLVDGIDSGLAYFDRVIAGPDSIRSRLALLQTCPASLIWDRYDGDVEFFRDETALLTHLRSLGEHCRAAGSALIEVFGGERGLVLGFLRASEVARCVELATTAGAEIVVYGTDET